MAKVRKDNKGRNLRPGETQRADGSYMYVYKLGTKKKYLYDSDLASLRVKEKQINKDKDDGIRTQEAMKLTLNDMFKVYMNNNIKLKPSTRANYLYRWGFYVKEEPFANMPVPRCRPCQYPREQNAASGLDRADGPVAAARPHPQQLWRLGSAQPAGRGQYPHGAGAGRAADGLSRHHLYHRKHELRPVS